MKRLERVQAVWDTDDYQRACKRVQGRSAHDLLAWADEAGSLMCKLFGEYRKYGSTDYLLELKRAVSSLQAVIEELIAREEADRI